MAKITIKELESLTAHVAGRILRKNGNLAGKISRVDETRQAYLRGWQTLPITS